MGREDLCPLDRLLYDIKTVISLASPGRSDRPKKSSAPTDCTQDQEENLPRMPRELVSTLKVAQEEPNPRPRPQYHGFYRMPLLEDEDEDIIVGRAFQW